MKNIKNFKAFLESYSEELDQVLDNPENEFIVLKGEDILVGFEFLTDAFEHIAELLEGDGVISDEQKYEFQDYVFDSGIGDDADQFEVDNLMKELLDKFEVIEPYKIRLRSELEETPIDMSDEIDLDEDELEEVLSESAEPVYIVGTKDGKEVELDSFGSSEEAEGFLPDYKTIYNEYSDLKIVHKEVNESKSSCDCGDTCTCGDDCQCGDDCTCKECGK